MFSRNQNAKKNSGFTIMEVLVVISIVGVLATIVIVGTTQARNNAKDKQIKAAMGEMRLDAQLYYERYKSYGTVSFSDNDSNTCSGTSGTTDRDTVFTKSNEPLSLSTSVLEIYSVSKTRVFCATSPGAWAFAAPLANRSEDANSWRVDSAGNQFEVYIQLDGLSITQSEAYMPFSATNPSCTAVDPTP